MSRLGLLRRAGVGGQNASQMKQTNNKSVFDLPPVISLSLMPELSLSSMETIRPVNAPVKVAQGLIVGWFDLL